jgi:hypothetical protein
MRPSILWATISFVALYTLVVSGCSILPGLVAPTPIIIVVTATSAPTLPLAPTSKSIAAILTPLPLLPSPTQISLPTLPPTAPSATSTESVLPKSATSTVIIPTPTSKSISAILTPPPQPTQVVLPQLPVFDKDGNNMDGKALGTALAKTYLSFQVIVCSPDCKNKPDGNGVTSVDFAFYKGTTKSRNSLNGKSPVYKTTEHNRPYCAFGGDDPCPLWIFAERNSKWPNGATIDNGDYTLLVKASGNNNGLWTSVLNFTIQR